MTSLWEQLEPLIAGVQRPARSIGFDNDAIPSERADDFDVIGFSLSSELVCTNVLEDFLPGIVTPAAEVRPEGVTLVAHLTTRPRAVCPPDLLVARCWGRNRHRVLRTHQWIERDSLLREPVEAASAHGEPLGVRP